MSTETFYFVNPAALQYRVRQICGCECSAPVSKFCQVTGLYCNLETGREGVDYEWRQFTCSVCGTPYEVRLACTNQRPVRIRDERARTHPRAPVGRP